MKILINNTYSMHTYKKTFLSLVFVLSVLLIPLATFADNSKNEIEDLHGGDKGTKAEMQTSIKQKWHWNWNTLFTHWPFTSKNNPKPIDTAAPIINSFTIIPQTTRAEVQWNTNKNTRAIVFYGTTTPVVIKSLATSTKTTYTSVSSVNSLSVFDNANTKTQGAITLKHLSATTTYYAVLVVRDQSGNVTISPVVAFTTKGTISNDTKAPVISNLITTIKSTTTLGVSWTTNELATSKVFYGTSTLDVNNTATLQVASGSLRTYHSFDIPILSTTTPEHFVIQSVDVQGNTRTSTEYSVFIPF